MTELEKEIRDNYSRMNQELSKKSFNYSCGNTAESYEALSQYGYAMAYYPTREEAEKHVIDFYSDKMFLIRQ